MTGGIRMMRTILACILALAFPGLARAEWLQASSPHFVIYADTSQANIQRFSQEMEKYHSAVAFITNVDIPLPSPSNRVTVYVVGSDSDVKRLYGDPKSHVAGFYMPLAGGSFAVVPRVSGSGQNLDFSKIILLHEYAHHFMISVSGFGMPRWYSEGGAEFFASASFTPDGFVWLGKPAQHRAGELYFAKDVKAANLLDPASYVPPKGNGYDAFYGKSWLLFHYLTFEPSRNGQLQTYLRLLTQGKSSREAGLEAFGDFTRLESDLDKYLQRSRIGAFKVPPARINPGATQVRALSAGYAAMMPIIVRSKSGVNPQQAAEVIKDARAVAGRFPGDGAVLAALAEAEFDSGHDAQAIAAADAAIAIDPGQVNAYVQKGYALFHQAETSRDPAAYRKARAPFLALNRIENDHPLPLIYFYQSFLRDGVKPSATAILGLERAAQLAPFDLGLRMTVARQQLQDGRKDAARRNLMPVAFSPHGGELAEQAQRMIARMDAEPNWDGKDSPSDPTKASSEQK